MKMKKQRTYRNWFDTSHKPDPSFQPKEQHFTILDLIWEFGILADYQLMELMGIKKSRLHELMSQLWNNRFVNRPNPKVRAGYNYMFWVLAKSGARVVARRQGIELRDLDWIRKPSRTQTHHDISVNDFRVIIQTAIKANDEFTFHDWIGETTFRSWQDTVYYNNLKGEQTRRRFVADGYMRISRHKNGEDRPFFSRLLLEVELSPKANPRFAEQKIMAGMAYIESDIYPKRFGSTGARILYIVPNREKMENYRRASERAIDSEKYRYFYFTTFDDVRTEDILFTPIWWRPGDKEPVSLF